MISLIMSVLGFILPNIFHRIMPDKSPEEINRLIDEIMPEVQQMVESGVQKAQASITQAEASSAFKFVAYARATLIWVCIIIAIYGGLIIPFMAQFFPHVHMFQPNLQQWCDLLTALLGVSVPIHVAHYLPPKKK